MAEILGTPGNDELSDEILVAENDSIFGLEGNDTIMSWAGNDSIFGNQGNDNLSSWLGDDVVFGGKGDDTITGSLETGNHQFFGNLDADWLSGGGGNDSLFGGQANDVIFGGEGNDLVSGDKGDDTISGDQGNDFVSGGEGNDLLQGAEFFNFGFGEIDTLVGGAGLDTFILDDPDFYVGSGNNDFALIADYNPTEDTISVSSLEDIVISDIDLGFGVGAGIFNQSNDLIAFLQGISADEL